MLIHVRLFLHLNLFLAASSVCAALPQPKMLVNTPENCKRITGYGKHDLQGVARGYKVPLDTVRFVKAEWGRNQAGGYQCNMVFNTPSGRKHCTVFNIVQDEFIFGQVVTIPGNKAICFDPKR
jgi:hypothetical protein